VEKWKFHAKGGSSRADHGERLSIFYSPVLYAATGTSIQQALFQVNDTE
jgi:hypothetical protein